MLSFLLAGDGQVAAESTTRAQLPLLLGQAANVSTVALDIATEADSAFDITVFMGAALIPVDQAVETDTAQDMTVLVTSNQFIPVDLAEEADSAFDMAVVAPAGPLFIPVDQAIETDSAFEVRFRRSAMNRVIVNTALLLTPVSEIELDLTPTEVQ